MRRILVFGGIFLLGFLFSQVNKLPQQDVSCSKADVAHIQNPQKEQTVVIRDFLFANLLCSNQTEGSSLTRIPSRTLQQIQTEKWALCMNNQMVSHFIRHYADRAIPSYKTEPYSKNYYVYFLNRLIC